MNLLFGRPASQHVQDPLDDSIKGIPGHGDIDRRDKIQAFFDSGEQGASAGQDNSGFYDFTSQIMADAEYRSGMTVAGRARAIERFSVDAMVSAYARLYTQLTM